MVVGVGASELGAALGRIETGDHILYLETDMAMQAALIAGAHSQFTSALGLLKSDPASAKSWLTSHPPTVLASVTPRKLLVLRGLQRPLFQSTPYGFPLAGGATLHLVLPAKAQVLFLKSNDQSAISVTNSAGEPCPAGERTQEGWSQVDLSACLQADAGAPNRVAITGRTMVTGLSIVQPRARLSWPWGEAIAYQFTGSAGMFWAPAVVKGDFSLASIDSGFADPLLAPLLPRLEAFDDASQVIFWKVR